MYSLDRSKLNAGFTLIELLIVVAIIAILAAIAVPNFLEAQTRAKVSRCAADMRSLRTGLESYRVDSNAYPETDFGTGVFPPSVAGAGLDRLSTPVAYMTSIPRSPFKEDKIGGDPRRHAISRVLFLYVRSVKPNGPNGPGFSITDSLGDGIDDFYMNDRVLYVKNNAVTPSERLAQRAAGFWELKSVGPNNEDDFNTIGNSARSYDPTNGTVSPGDVVVFSDIQGFAGRNQ